MEYPVAILNTSIATTPGTYTLWPVSLAEARRLTEGEIVSAVGHEATAQILTSLLWRDVPVNRIQFAQAPGQVALVFKLRGRPPEGQVLTVEEIDRMGYEFMFLYKHSHLGREAFSSPSDIGVDHCSDSNSSPAAILEAPGAGPRDGSR